MMMMMKLAYMIAFGAVVTAPVEAEVDPWGSIFGPEGVPGSGYGCDRPCGGDDDPDDSYTVHYTIRAKIETHIVENTVDNENFANSFGSISGYPVTLNPPLNPGEPVSTYARTWVGDRSESNRDFCQGMDGVDMLVGPCLQFYRGDKIKIKVINEMDDEIGRAHV